MMTLISLLETAASTHSDKAAVISSDLELTFGELYVRSLAVSATVAGAYPSGSRVAVLAPNIPEFVELYFGLSASGAIAVPLNFRLTADEIAYILNDSEPAAIVYDVSLENVLQHAVTMISWQPDLIRVGDPTGNAVDASGYAEWLEAGARSPDEARHTTEPRDDFLIAYTSGTTGRPKGALSSQQSMIETIELQQKHYGGLSPADRLLTVMPLFHINAAMFAFACGVRGTTNVIQPSGAGNGSLVLDAVNSHCITLLSVVPTILRQMLDAVRENPAQRPESLRALLCGSAPLDFSDKEAVGEVLGAKLYEIYGATEFGIATVLTPEHVLDRAGSVGRVVPGKDLEVRDADGVRAAEGEIWSRGLGTMFLRYWGLDEATRSSRDGDSWVTVGDIGRIDDEGFLYILDRKSDMIISGGENIYPQEIESHLQHFPGVDHVAVIGIPDEKWGEKVHAVLVMSQGGSEPTLEQVREFLEDKVASYKRPRSLDVWDAVPQTATGKIQRQKIRYELVTKADRTR